MIRLSARPFLAVYVVWHPSFVEGEDLSAALFNHFRRDLFSNVAGGTGLSVVFRSTPLPGKQLPLGIDLDEAETSAVVVLLDGHLTGDPTWMIYVDDLVTRARSGGLRARVFPVAMDSAAYNITGSTKEVSYVRWDSWFGDASADRVRRLTTQLAYEFCRMLRHYLESLKHPAEAESELAKYLRKVSVFLSHSKHDSYGEQIAKRIRDSIHQETGLASFFDVRDIPAGLPFADVLMHYVRVSAVIAIHTDSYSSREWCRREIIEAKRANVPLVVADCITDFEERGFPYLGNVPVIRMEPDAQHRISHVIGWLLDEVLKDFLWRCRVQLAVSHGVTDVDFLPRPPELIALVGLANARGELPNRTVIYPDPPIGQEEIGLFDVLASGVVLRSFTEWLAEQTA